MQGQPLSASITVDVTDDDTETAKQHVNNVVVSDALGAAMLRAAADELDPPKPTHRVTRDAWSSTKWALRPVSAFTT